MQIKFIMTLILGSTLVGCIQTESTTVPLSTGDLVPLVEVVPPQNNETESLPSDENQIQNDGTVGGDNGSAGLQEGFAILNINSNQKTKDGFVDLRMITLDRNQMKVSFDPSCSTGVWEEWSELATYPIPLTLQNSRVRVSVQFKDFDGGIKGCHVMSFNHDNQGPTIIFKKYPAATIAIGTDVEIQADVTDGSNMVQNVKCIFQGVSQNCYAGINDVKISSLPAANYKFEVTAEDDLGNQSSSAVTWNVEETTKNVEQKISVNDYKKIDILFVIDNSGSMQYEQKSMGSRTANFLSVLRGLDYRIAVSTTDPVHKTLGDGRIIPLTSSTPLNFITSAMPESQAQTLLSSTLQRSEVGSGVEQGIRAAYRLVERFAAGDTLPKSFFREGAQFAVVLISDEDESANTDKNDPLKLVQLINTTFNSQKRFNYHSIITRPDDTQCKSTYGASFGERYKTMSELTGGLIGDVCATDYASQVQDAAEGIRNLLKTLTLSCIPVTGKPITIQKDGTVITNTYILEGLNLKFTTELTPGNYQVNYTCLR